MPELVPYWIKRDSRFAPSRQLASPCRVLAAAPCLPR